MSDCRRPPPRLRRVRRRSAYPLRLSYRSHTSHTSHRSHGSHRTHRTDGTDRTHATYAVTAMRILHVVPTYLPARRYGGPVVAVHGLCKALAGRGHSVDVFTTNVDGDRTLDVPTGRVVEMDGVRVHYFPSTYRRLYLDRKSTRLNSSHG